MSEMMDVLNNFKDLPAMPNVIMRALTVIKNPESGAKELGNIISYDQALSTKVLTLVNSSYYGFAQQISSIPRAISLIGMLKAKNIIMTVAMRPMLTSMGGKVLWEHAIKTAVGCELIAKRIKTVDPDDAFMAGFLHDIGKIILRSFDQKLYDRAESLGKEKGADIIEVERSFFKVDHCIIGSQLAQRWQLPILINNVIKYHHRPSLSSFVLPCLLVNVVDYLVRDNFDENDNSNSFNSIISSKFGDPKMLRDNIFSKANVLLAELSR